MAEMERMVQRKEDLGDRKNAWKVFATVQEKFNENVTVRWRG